MEVYFPRGLIFDLDFITADFETRIQQAFHDYTAETNKDYTYQDKLSFIDRMVCLLHGEKTDDDLLEKWIVDYTAYQRREYDEFVTRDDIYSDEGMVAMINVGREQQSLYGEYVRKGSREDEKIMKLLCRAIKAVMDYGA